MKLINRWLATTQFQSIGARQAFPCFDEPGFRSTFNVTIGRAEGYHSLANAPLKETVPMWVQIVKFLFVSYPMQCMEDYDLILIILLVPEWKTGFGIFMRLVIIYLICNDHLILMVLRFWKLQRKVTVSMPTYLVAMVISDFVSVDAPTGISTYDVKVNYTMITCVLNTCSADWEFLIMWYAIYCKELSNFLVLIRFGVLPLLQTVSLQSSQQDRQVHIWLLCLIGKAVITV